MCTIDIEFFFQSSDAMTWRIMIVSMSQKCCSLQSGDSFTESAASRDVSKLVNRLCLARTMESTFLMKTRWIVSILELKRALRLQARRSPFWRKKVRGVTVEQTHRCLVSSCPLLGSHYLHFTSTSGSLIMAMTRQTAFESLFSGKKNQTFQL